MSDYLHISDVSMAFDTPGGSFKALQSIDLRVAQGELVTLIGHSGCGKSTVLNVVAGLYHATSGGVILDGREVDDPGPDRAVVFQNHSLLPWLSAYENVALAVRQVFKGRKSRAEMAAWVRHNLELVHMGHAMHKRPGEISGGMKQRVGIARALAMEPKVLLMDEPFGALDSLTRSHMQDTLMEIHARLNNTVIMITHDVDEAVLLSDRIVMMTNGPAATIGEILHVDLLRPRDRLRLADDATYNHYRAEVLRFLHDRHAKPDVPVHVPVISAVAAPEPPPQPAAPVLRVGKRLEQTELTLGFIPLTDCAPLVVAKERKLFEQHGLSVTLSRESSWANVRDKVSLGMLDGAQMPAGIPLAAGARQDTRPMLTGLSLDLNGNAVTVSEALYAEMAANGEPDLQDALGSAQSLARVVTERRRSHRPRLTFATVLPESSHNLLLRYWMASAGIDPDRDVRLVVVPPPQMVNHLRAGTIAGYCVGEPWNTCAVGAGIGRILVTSYDIWNNHPEKVLGVTRAWAEAHPNTHEALLAALLEACVWLDSAVDNRVEVCRLLALGRYVNAPQDQLEASLTGNLRFAPEGLPAARPDFNVFHRYAANFPWRSHALWTLVQMQRWGVIGGAQDPLQVAQKVYRPDLYRQAAKRLGLPAPETDSKRDGVHLEDWVLGSGANAVQMGPDWFMDNRIFDPRNLKGYLAGLAEQDGVEAA